LRAEVRAQANVADLLWTVLQLSALVGDAPPGGTEAGEADAPPVGA